jgi:hypothetical protein
VAAFEQSFGQSIGAFEQEILAHLQNRSEGASTAPSDAFPRK